jgi:hypothetical protein
MTGMVLTALRRLAKRGTVVKHGTSRNVQWKLATNGGSPDPRRDGDDGDRGPALLEGATGSLSQFIQSTHVKAALTINARLSDAVSPAICMNEGCDFTCEMEPDQDAGYCEECHTNTMKAAPVLAGLI